MPVWFRQQGLVDLVSMIGYPEAGFPNPLAWKSPQGRPRETIGRLHVATCYLAGPFRLQHRAPRQGQISSLLCCTKMLPRSHGE